MSKEQYKSNRHIGDFKFPRISFSDLDKIFKEFDLKEFKERTNRKRFHRVNQVLLKLIQEDTSNEFLFPAVLEFMKKVNQKKILREPYNFTLFEFWLNQFSELSSQDNYTVRGKIFGKYIPREDYQSFFPIGMNKTFSGTHFVAAHLSPDVDTMVASFWGWVDAFAARVGNARHIWNLPGGPPDSPVTTAFKDMFGEDIFSLVAITAPSLTLSAIDLVTQKGFFKRSGSTSISAVDFTPGEKAIILIDENGYYLGDWHRSDVDPVRQILIRFKSCLRWFENNIHGRLISLFAKKNLTTQDLPNFLSSIFDISIEESEPFIEFNEVQKRDLHEFFSQVLRLKKGIKGTFRELNEALAHLSVVELKIFQEELESLQQSNLFDSSGALKEDRPAIFNQLEKLINQLDNAIHMVRDYVERLDVVIDIKTKVFGISPQFVTIRSDIEDVRLKMQQQEYLTVVISEENDNIFPIGVIWASSIQQPILGTVSFRDFCNQDEVRMASYLTPISVVDHHKTSFKTSAPPLAIVGDAQSCNILIAEQDFLINDRHSLAGQTKSNLEKQISQIQQTPNTPSKLRILNRLLQKVLVAEINEGFFVNSNREIAEYMSFLHAILDDTDLLTKVTKRDVLCIVDLLNRLKSLIALQEVEVINLDGILKDTQFVASAAKRILKNPEMYSFYKKVYESKEQEVEKMLHACLEGQYDPIFADTKEQNGCCRVGQTKLFTINLPTYQKYVHQLIENWVKNAAEKSKKHPEIDLHLHMISTISSADEVYEDRVGKYDHKDQLWFWVPPTQKAYDHLTSFITAFQVAHKFGHEAFLEFTPATPNEMKHIFTRNCPEIPVEETSNAKNSPVVILHYPAGLLNSRKAMITPYLPRQI